MSTHWIMTTPAGSTFAIHRARHGDVERIVALSEDAATRVQALGYEPGTPPRPLPAIVADRIAQGMLYLATLAGEPVASVTLRWQPEEMWHDLPLDALYIHGLMVGSIFAGQGIGATLLGWAEQLAAAAGKTAVRLDCMASNPALRAYYTRAGYAYRGDATVGTYVGSRFEKMVAAPPMEGDAARDA